MKEFFEGIRMVYDTSTHVTDRDSPSVMNNISCVYIPCSTASEVGPGQANCAPCSHNSYMTVSDTRLGYLVATPCRLPHKCQPPAKLQNSILAIQSGDSNPKPLWVWGETLPSGSIVYCSVDTQIRTGEVCLLY